MPPAEVAETERVLVVNPASGGGADPARVEDAVRERVPCRVLVTRKAGDARRFAAAACAAGATSVIVAGGDGTVHDVVQGLLDGLGNGDGKSRPLPTLSILPTGTGNDLARCLGIPLDMEAAASLFRGSGRIRELDLMAVELDGDEEVAVNAVVVGSGGRVGEVLDPDEKERWGPLSYLRSAAEVVLDLEPVSITLSADGEPAVADKVLNIVVANGRYAARGVPISPGADPGDGRLDLVTVREAGIREVVEMLPALLHGSHPDHPSWAHRLVKRVRITAVGPDPLPVSLDGEHREAREIRIRLLERRIPVRVPHT